MGQSRPEGKGGALKIPGVPALAGWPGLNQRPAQGLVGEHVG
jgi:hypothetical protein